MCWNQQVLHQPRRNVMGKKTPCKINNFETRRKQDNTLKIPEQSKHRQ